MLGTMLALVSPVGPMDERRVGFSDGLLETLSDGLTVFVGFQLPLGKSVGFKLG